MKAILEASGLSTKNLVKCTVLLESMEDFKAVNEVYGKPHRLERLFCEPGCAHC